MRQDQFHRVKVYFLSDVWEDNGTGYCFGEVYDDEPPCLVVRNELDQTEQLLKAAIEGTIQFQRQQDTLIVWTTAEGQSIALSFQEKEGCSKMCDFIVHVFTSRLAPKISLVSVISGNGDSQDGDITELIVGPVNLPPEDPSSDDLLTIFNCFNENPNSAFQRQVISSFIQDQDYIHKLVLLFHQNEANRKIKNLHLLCNIVKTLIVSNESLTIEMILDDKNMMGVVGILEYDPDFPTLKANHRSYLQDESSFKEVLPVKDEKMKNLIKRTFRLQFLKDVVLARLLDDPSFNVISTLIHFNHIEVIRFLESGDFIDLLLQKYDESQHYEVDIKRDGIKLLHQFVLIAKNLPTKQKTRFYKSLIRKGLFKTIDFVLKDDSLEVRVQGTELIVSIIEHDVLLVNGPDEQGFEETTLSEENDNGAFSSESYEDERDDQLTSKTSRVITLSDDMTLFQVLTKFLLEDNDPGLRMQAFEALRSLLDPASTSSSAIFGDQDSDRNLNTTQYFMAFYKEVSPKLFEPLIQAAENETKVVTDCKEDMYMYLFDLMSFCSKDKVLSRSFFMENHILKGISTLVKPRHKLQLKLSAVRCLKFIIMLNDEYYIRYIISNDLLQNVFELFQESQFVPDLAYSTVLDLLEIILMGIEKGGDKKNFKLLANYVVSNYQTVLETIEDVSSGKDLIDIVNKPQMGDNRGEQVDDDEDYEDMITRQEILTEPLDAEDSEVQTAIFNETRNLSYLTNGVTVEKRLREDDEEENDDEGKHNQFTSTMKKSTLKEKFTNAGKKFASKLVHK